MKQLIILSLSVFLLLALLSQILIGNWNFSIVPAIFFTIVAYILLKFNNIFLRIIPLFIFFAIPLPLTLPIFPNILKDARNMFSGAEPIIVTIFGIFLAMYSITYIFSLVITLKIKAFSILSFLPIAHIGLSIILFIFAIRISPKSFF